MKMKLEEYGNLIDSRLVDLQSAIEEYRNKAVLMTSSGQIELASRIVKCAEALKEAHESMEEAEEQEQIDEIEAEYKKEFGEE